MRLTCPACGAMASAETWTNDADARATLRIVAELPWGVSRQVPSYLGLFRPASGKGRRWSKALALAADLKALIDLPHIQWDRQPARPNRAEAWARAMERILEYPPRTLPLKNHNYLRAVAYEIADELDKQLEIKRCDMEKKGDINYFRQSSEMHGFRDSAPSRITKEEMKKITEQRYRKRKKK